MSSKKIPHDWTLSHDIDGTGRVTKCSQLCRAHCRWLDEQADLVGVEPLGDETWGAEELGTRRPEPRLPDPRVRHTIPREETCGKPGKIEGLNDLFGVMPNAPAPEPITALFGEGNDVSPRESALREATSLITGDRNAQYGPPTQDFQRTADLLTALGYRFADFNTADGVPYFRDLTASDVAIIMIQLKMSRIIQSRNKRDSWVDLAGYAGCGYECTTEEYN